MGVFHCPFGCPFYDAEGCVDCGMCLATTKEEMVEASRKIRVYLKAHGGKSAVLKKVAVCGKGGVGKSTVVALMAKAFEERGYTVLVIDTDESNPGLHRIFGLEQKPKALLTLHPRFFSGDSQSKEDWLPRDEIALQEVPSEFIVSRNNLRFMMVGKIEDPFQGCACSMASLTKDLIEKIVLKDKEVLLIDMEAGIESFGRGVERSVDTVLIIVEPSFESLALAEKIDFMARGIGISRVRAILNKVPSKEIIDKLSETLRRKGIRVEGYIRHSPEIFEACLEGRPVYGTFHSKDIDDILKSLLSNR